MDPPQKTKEIKKLDESCVKPWRNLPGNLLAGQDEANTDLPQRTEDAKKLGDFGGTLVKPWWSLGGTVGG